MANKDGHNIGCGASIAIVIGCAILTYILIDPKPQNQLLTVFFGLLVGYGVASYVNSSDRFKDL